MPNLAEAVKPYKRSERERQVKMRHRYPTRIEKSYQYYLTSIIDEINRKIRDEFQAEIKSEIRSDSVTFRNDSLASLLQKIVQISDNVISPFQTLRNISNALFNVNERNIRQTIEKAIGVNVVPPQSEMSDMLDSWVVQNVSLVTKMTDEYLVRIQGIVGSGFRSGLSYRDVSKQLQDAVGISKRRATLIARDQIGSLNGQITQKRNEDLGIKEYVWRTVKDERVRGNPSGRYPKARPSHYSREGKTYTWKDGAGSQDKHPGDGIQCRCYAESVVKF